MLRRLPGRTSPMLPPIASFVLVCLLFTGAACRDRSLHSHAAERPKAKGATEKLVDLLKEKPAPCADNLIATATMLKSHLASLGIDLVVALVPDLDGIMIPDSPLPESNSVDLPVKVEGKPQSEWTKTGASLFEAERRLQEAGVKVCNFLPAMHAAFVKYPDRSQYRDAVHLNHLGIAIVARGFAKEAGWKVGRTDATKSMWIGDCHAQGIRMCLMADGYGEPATFWRNASSCMMGNELMELGKADFQGVTQVVWYMPSTYFSGGRIFPPPSTQKRIRAAGEKTCVASITQASSIPEGIERGAPYPDALSVVQFRGEDGQTFMGLVWAMRKRAVEMAVKLQWKTGKKLRLRLVPWERACDENPGLRNIQQFDDQTDFLAPRYFILSWQGMD